MKRPPPNELRFQNHIIDSYHLAGAHASKWASEWLAFKPDLICSLPDVGLHLLEVKSIPTFTSVTKNCLTIGQRLECRKYLDAGALVWAAVISGSSDARGSSLGLFDTQAETWVKADAIWVPYVPRLKFDVQDLVQRTLAWYNQQSK